jgi:hypothetical protein
MPAVIYTGLSNGYFIYLILYQILMNNQVTIIVMKLTKNAD